MRAPRRDTKSSPLRRFSSPRAPPHRAACGPPQCSLPSPPPKGQHPLFLRPLHERPCAQPRGMTSECESGEAQTSAIVACVFASAVVIGNIFDRGPTLWRGIVSVRSGLAAVPAFLSRLRPFTPSTTDNHHEWREQCSASSCFALGQTGGSTHGFGGQPLQKTRSCTQL